jgi:uncharacterized protein (UPF0335 family)
MQPKSTTNKTKQDLLDEIADLKQQIANMEKYKMYKDMSDEFKLIYEAFKDSGFDCDQAFELLKLSITNAANMTRR